MFPPVQRDRLLLVDGGLVDLVPAALARTLSADIVVVVDVSGPLPHRPPCTLLQIMVSASNLQPGVAERLARDADLVLAPAVDEYACWELSRIPKFEQAGRAAAERALPLMRALVARRPGAPGLATDSRRVAVRRAALWLPRHRVIRGPGRSRVTRNPQRWIAARRW